MLLGVSFDFESLNPEQQMDSPVFVSQHRLMSLITSSHMLSTYLLAAGRGQSYTHNNDTLACINLSGHVLCTLKTLLNRTRLLLTRILVGHCCCCCRKGNGKHTFQEPSNRSKKIDMANFERSLRSFKCRVPPSQIQVIGPYYGKELLH